MCIVIRALGRASEELRVSDITPIIDFGLEEGDCRRRCHGRFVDVAQGVKLGFGGGGR